MRTFLEQLDVMISDERQSIKSSEKFGDDGAANLHSSRISLLEEVKAQYLIDLPKQEDGIMKLHTLEIQTPDPSLPTSGSNAKILLDDKELRCVESLKIGLEFGSNAIVELKLAVNLEANIQVLGEWEAEQKKTFDQISEELNDIQKSIPEESTPGGSVPT